MSPSALKSMIKKKFRTLSRFAELADVDESELRKMFMPFYENHTHYITMRQEIEKQAKALTISAASGEISEEQREWLKTKISESGGAVAFCEENPEFKSSEIYYIMNGKRIRMSGKAKEVFVHFGYEFEEKV